MPGVQNPHCRPCFSRNASWIGCNSPFDANPSTVVTLHPSAWTANIVHDLVAFPSTRTVQAPQLLVSQPTWVPVRSNSSLSTCDSNVLGGTCRRCAVPLIVIVTSAFMDISLGLRWTLETDASLSEKLRRESA